MFPFSSNHIHAGLSFSQYVNQLLSADHCLTSNFLPHDLQEEKQNDDVEEITTCNSNNHVREMKEKKTFPKKDRHSKINTAQGPRDRRMRLSLPVARKFFDLQDKLEFDKPSKTVEWLMKHAETEIKNLSNGILDMNCGCASTSGPCGVGETISLSDTSMVAKNEGRKENHSRKYGFDHVAKESREKARARARERTKEKMWSRRIKEDRNLESSLFLRSWNPFHTDASEESSSVILNANANPQFETASEMEALSPQEQVSDDAPIAMRNWNTPFSSILDHTNYIHGGFQQEQEQQEDEVVSHAIFQEFSDQYQHCLPGSFFF